MIALSMASIASEMDDFKRKLLFLCWLNSELKKDNIEFISDYLKERAIEEQVDAKLTELRSK